MNLIPQKGIVIWLTGLSGSGKSTLADGLKNNLILNKTPVCVLDGDNIRHGLNSDLGFSDKDRIENIRRVTEIALILRDAGITVIVALISPFRQMREFARTKVGRDRFFEIYVKATLETCISRDPKGLYKKALNKEIPDFTGISSEYEEPVSADFIIDTEKYNVKESCDRLTEFIFNKLTNEP
jgi:adenylyl-sulfate kinase